MICPSSNGQSGDSRDGSRVERDDDRIRLIMRGGYDWTKRYPWIVGAAQRYVGIALPHGNAVALGGAIGRAASAAVAKLRKRAPRHFCRR
jgi:ATP-dependent DNA ligase